MEHLSNGDVYQTEPRKLAWFAARCPTMVFYWKWLRQLLDSGRLAKRGKYATDEWTRASRGLLDSLESVGVRCRIEGLDRLRSLHGPCVFVANHMSTLETVILPCILNAQNLVTFVVRKSLMKLPTFGRILATRDPIVLDQESARQDLETVLREGPLRLERGLSVVVFPQGTRSTALEKRAFNSIGVKLARRAATPVVPIALKTDAWGQGRVFAEFGKIDPAKPVRFAIGDALPVEGTGREAHERIFRFIADNMERFERETLETSENPSLLTANGLYDRPT